MNRLVLIDGINFFYKGSWSPAKSYSFQGEDVTYVRAFFANVVSMMKKLGERSTYIVCWDGGYDERMRISSKAVSEGLIPKTYKQERRDSRNAVVDEEEIAQAKNFMQQMNLLKEIIPFTRIAQISIKGEEADDLVGSFATKFHKQYDEVLLVTTDRDYYQLLGGNVKIYNSSKNEYKSVDFLKQEYNLDSGQQWVDVGALAGESGPGSDTIYGVPGIGYGTASKLISQYGTLDNLLQATRNAIALDVKKFDNDPMKLYVAVKSKQYKMKSYVKEMYVLAHEKIVAIAKKLKQMRTWLDLSIPETHPNWVALEQWFSINNVPISKNDLNLLVEG